MSDHDPPLDEPPVGKAVPDGSPERTTSLDLTRTDGGEALPFATEHSSPATAPGDGPRPPSPEQESAPLPRDSASEHGPTEILSALGLPPERFTVEEKIGKGGSGTVYAIHDRYLDRSIAVKHVSAAQNGPKIERFIQEARVAAKLEHPNIVPIYNLDLAIGGQFYLAMRRIEGQSLGEVIRRSVSEGRRHALIATPNDVVNIAVKLCDAVGCAHARGVIHQDIKPDNIMLGAHGEVLLVDWGTASGASTQGRRGTPAYMAPEQARKEGSGTHSDIYGIGATMFHALYLRYPTRVDDTELFWARKQRGEIDRPDHGERRHVPPRLAAIVLKALEPDPEHRYLSVAELTRDLHALQGGLAVSAYRESLSERILRWYRLRSRMCNAIGGMLVLLLAVSGVYLYDLDRAYKATVQAELKAFHLEKERTERWHPVLDQDFTRDTVLDPKLKPNRPGRIGRDGLPFGFDSPLSTLTWTEPIGVEQKVEVTFSCDSYPYLRIDLCMNAAQAHTGFALIDQSVYLEASHPAWRALTATHLGQKNMFRYDGRNTVVFWREGNRFRAELNGVKVLDYYDSTATWSEACGLFSLERFFALGPLTIHALRVWRRVSPDYVSVLEPGRAFLREGNAPAARAWFEAHLQNRLSDAITREAEYLITRAMPAEARERAQKLAAIAEDEAHPFRAQAMHDLALLLAKTDRWQETLDLVCRVSRLAPELGTLDAVSPRLYAHLRTLPNEEKTSAVARITSLPLTYLSLLNFGFNDLSILRGNEARKLELSGNPFTSLSPLRGAHPCGLELGPAPIDNLGPLEGLPLEWLTMDGMPMADLSPLHGMPLQLLKLKNCPSIDFRTMRGVRTRLLQIDGCPINERSALGDTGARVLRIGNVSLPDIGFAASLPLFIINLRGNRLPNIEPLRGSALVECSLTDNLIEDIGPLASCRNVRRVCLSGNPVRDISPLRGLPLERLSIDRTKVTDLSALKGMPLQQLDLAHTPVTDISALAGLPLEDLNLSGTAIGDLSVLSSLSRLNKLDVRGVSLSDDALRVLGSLSIPNLSIDLDRRSLAALSRIRTITDIGPFAGDYIRRTGPAIAAALAVPAVSSEQALNLRALAAKGQQVERLLIPVPMSYAQATAFCRSLGGTLTCPATQLEIVELSEYLGATGHRWELKIWMGLEIRDGALSVQSGAPVDCAASSVPSTALEELRRGAHVWTNQGSIDQGHSWDVSPNALPTGEPVRLPFIVEWRPAAQ